MPHNHDSQCYFVQLQIDTYLDGELSPTQMEVFQGHVQQCVACARELHFAQTLHDHVLDLPLLDCDDRSLEPVYRLGNVPDASGNPIPSFWQGLQELMTTVPAFARYAVPAVLLLAIVLPVTSLIFNPAPADEFVAEQSVQGVTPQYTVAEIQQALMELNLAIEYLNGIGQRTEVMIGDRFLITPLTESLDASFEVIRRINTDSLQDDPI